MVRDEANNDKKYSGLNWTHHVKTLLEENLIGLGNVWRGQNLDDINYLFIKQRILDIFKQSWYSTINDSSRLSH